MFVCLFVCLFSLSWFFFGFWLLIGECLCLCWGFVRKEGRGRWSTEEAGAQQDDGKGEDRVSILVLDSNRCCRRRQKGRAVQGGRQTRAGRLELPPEAVAQSRREL